jgi:hypothetical protein
MFFQEIGNPDSRSGVHRFEERERGADIAGGRTRERRTRKGARGMSKLSETGCTPIERNERKGIYSHEGRTSCGRGLRWTDDSGSRSRNATFSEVPHAKGKRDKADARNRTQATAAAIVDRNIARGDAGWTVRTDYELRDMRATGGATLAIIRAHGGDPQRVNMLERAFLHPAKATSDERRKLVKFMKRQGIIG